MPASTATGSFYVGAAAVGSSSSFACGFAAGAGAGGTLACAGAPFFAAAAAAVAPATAAAIAGECGSACVLVYSSSIHCVGRTSDASARIAGVAGRDASLRRRVSSLSGNCVGGNCVAAKTPLEVPLPAALAANDAVTHQFLGV